MITLLSPAKSLNFDVSRVKKSHQPVFSPEKDKLVSIMSKKSKKDIMKLMSVSEKIAELNVHRFKNFADQERKQAILAFSGDVYQGFKAEELGARELNFADKHIRILSGLYGLLRPLDEIQAYRLEMGTKLKYRAKKNLYELWGDKITKQLNEEILAVQHKAVINLASKEYFKSIQAKDLKAPIYEISFKENRNGKLTFVSFNAKRARGMMARYIVDKRIKNPESLLDFNYDNYKFEPSLSSEQGFTFIR